MKVLLDTCVLSELRKPDGLISVKSFVLSLDSSHVFLSSVSIGEIAKGIALLDEGKRKQELLLWLNGLEHGYATNILKVDSAVSRVWGEITANAQRRGKQVAMGDGLIAATAIQHGLHVITRNIKDFEPTGALIINPWLAH